MPYVCLVWIGYPRRNIPKKFIFIKLTKTNQSQNTSESESLHMFTQKETIKTKHPENNVLFFQKKVSSNKFNNVGEVGELTKDSFHVLLVSETRVISTFLTSQLKITRAKSFVK